ncbi:ethanolamine ammonia-lyase subunit EutC [Phreatobacter oligotrophus]|uniref:ethanolamine ammonia-lyase subunit EutC n=1 Tax=Phreatobacter oligotrophus TaxID=1122261 RepID=UPI002356339D|nr:ethanolamine ammonia-lyase subunit EutC [Phreatobacter oligotrophus]MBX9990784.1 ethanolamine ammonia-lyase subunit EutC [Phreatobacter oligotrophus]
MSRGIWQELAALTPARIGLGRTGSAQTTAETLRFALAHATARDAVHTPFDADRVASDIAALGLATLVAESAADNRQTYLLRPDLGRRLSADSRDRILALAADPVDLALVVGDGLSSSAVHAHACAMVAALLPHVRREGWSLAPVVVARQARVALGDEIGEILGARLVLMLIGERPGLSTPDSLGIYLTHAPRIGRNDGERNCISNIHGAGLSPDIAAFKAAWLMREALARRLTGVALKDESDGALNHTARGAIG